MKACITAADIVAGADVFVFSASIDSDRARILDFNVAEDALHLDLAGATSAQDVYDIFIATATEVGGQVRFVSAEGFSINLDNLSLADLTVANFVFDPGLATIL